MSTFTSQSLSLYNGADGRPVYISVEGQVHDVTSCSSFYGPGGPYQVFGGRECSRALALMAVDEKECNADLTGLNAAQLKTLSGWKERFNEKYPVVGRLIDMQQS
jgi:membrane-associated progesterone receptor component